MEAVVFQEHQYRLWDWGVVGSEFDLRNRWLLGAAMGSFPRNPWIMEPLLTIGSREEWAWVWGIATRVYEGEAPPAGCEDVTHYDNRIFWGGEDPPWAVGMKLGICIADHCFYR